MSEDQLHEGYLELVLMGGAVSAGSNAAGPVVQLRDDAGNYREEQRIDDEVVAWRLACDCSDPASFGHAKWTGPTWQRVPTRALEDLEAGRIFLAEGEAASDMMYREGVEEVARSRWLSEHISPAAALDQIREAQGTIASATDRLNEAVVFARASGKTWAEIGAAAGISRQSAHERWNGVA